MSDLRRLDEVGERRIIDEILKPRYMIQGVNYFGNDCAFVASGDQVGSGVLVATTDPCPEPVAALLGYDDLYYRGWLLAAINLSDIAAAGARPIGLLTSLILKNETTVDQFLRLLDGIDDCCRKCETQVIGGNIKEGVKIDLSATAIGYCKDGKCLSRFGCKEGDLIVVIGDLGLFWAGVLSIMNGVNLNNSEKKELLRNVLTPHPKVEVGLELAQRDLVSACLDNSDGLYASLITLADANAVQMHVEMDHITFSPDVAHVSSILGIESIRFAFGWGDWQLIACVDPVKSDNLRYICEQHGIPVYTIGHVKHGRGVVLEHNGKTAEMAPIDSQRFTNDSWFSVGLQSYIDILTKGSLWQE